MSSMCLPRKSCDVCGRVVASSEVSQNSSGYRRTQQAVRRYLISASTVPWVMAAPASTASPVMVPSL